MLTFIDSPVRKSMYGFAIAVAIGLSAIDSAHADGLLDSPEKLEEGVRSTAALTSDAIFPPLGRILLIRHDGLCGLRFTEFHREANPKEPARLYSGAIESISAQYEWYRAERDRLPSFIAKASGKDNVMRGSIAFDSIDRGPWYHAVGDNILKCARSQFLWVYPTGVVFAWGGGHKDFGIEVAPTAWERIADVDLEDPRLKWYRYEAERPETWIPLESLPGYGFVAR